MHTFFFVVVPPCLAGISLCLEILKAAIRNPCVIPKVSFPTKTFLQICVTVL